MSMNEHENQSFPLIFKGLQGRTGHHKKCGALPTIKPCLLAIRCHGVRALTRKENSSQGFCQCFWVQLHCRKSGPNGPEHPCSDSGILTWFSFDKQPTIVHNPWIVTDFLERLLVFNEDQKGNNRSVIPLNVPGRTRATLLDSASHILNWNVWVIFWKSDVLGINHCNYWSWTRNS